MIKARFASRERLGLTKGEFAILRRLNTPEKIQAYLDAMPQNFEIGGETCLSVREALSQRRALCIEGAMIAAAALWVHGEPPLLLDLKATQDYDHIVTLYRRNGCWGAISKTNHAVLRWRDPIYRNVRELAMTYAHEYNLDYGKKSMVAFSRPFSLARYAPARWLITPDDLDWLMDAVDASPHQPVAPQHALRRRRRTTRVELKSQDVTEWPVPRERRVAPTK